MPQDASSLGRAIGEAHRRYTNFINARDRWTGHLFQSRFASVAMDDTHLIAAVRYVSLNTARARLVQRPQDWLWSSARADLTGFDVVLMDVKPVIEMMGPHATGDLLLTHLRLTRFRQTC